MSKEVELHEAALAEANAAAEYYAERDADVARAFADEVEAALERIGRAPERWPIEEAPARRVRLKRYPFKLVYVVEPTRCFVLAVAHEKRRPGYWKQRR